MIDVRSDGSGARPLACATLLLGAVSAAAAALASGGDTTAIGAGWVWLRVPILSESAPWLGRDGEMLAVGDPEAAALAGGPRLRTVHPPASLHASRVVRGFDGTVYATGGRSAIDRNTVFRCRDPFGPSPRWDDLGVPSAGQVDDLAVAPDGKVWAIGDWGDVFRLDGSTWTKLPSPLPYHNVRLAFADDGTGWMLASTRSRTAVYRFDGSAFAVAARFGAETCETLLYADRDAAIVQGPDGLTRIGADGRVDTKPPDLAGFPPCGSGVVAMSGPASGWALSAGLLRRFESGRWTDVPAPLPFRAGALFYLGADALFAHDAGGAWWRLARASAPPAAPPTLPGFRRVEHEGWLAGAPIQGVAVLRLKGAEYLYLVDHESWNPTLPLRFRPGPRTTAGVDTWMSLSRRLRNEDTPKSGSWDYRYDVTALTADLNGDGTEDIVLVSMYDGVRILRNVRDDHFVDFTRESHVRGRALDDAVGACLLDADGDGDLDLYVTNALGPDRLWSNDGRAVFTDATGASGIETTEGGSMPACADLDGDGDTDVVVATYGHGILVHENLGVAGGAPRFRTHRLLAGEAGGSSEATRSTLNFNSVAVADLDGDGLPELVALAHASSDRYFVNRGAMRFVEDPSRLPARDPRAKSYGATAADFDGDGDLDLAVTGTGGVRLYRNEGGRLTWDGRSAPASREGGEPVVSRGSAAVDFDGDGDPDLAVGGPGAGSGFFENEAPAVPSLIVRVEGPVANRSAVGARIELRAAGAGSAAPPLAVRTIPGGSGYASMDGKEAWLPVPGGGRFDLRVRLPDGRRGELRGLSAPWRGVLSLDDGGAADAAWRFRHALDDPWDRRWAGLTLAALLLAGLTAAFLFRRGRIPFSGWAVLALVVPASIAVRSASALDPGPACANRSALAALALGAGALVLLRLRGIPRPAPEMTVELNVALRTFRHNETPRLATDRLRFVLENLGGPGAPVSPKRAGQLLEDLVVYRETVLPELVAIGRLALAAGRERPALVPAVARQSRLAAGLLAELRRHPGSLRAAARGLSEELRLSLAETAALVDRMRADTDRALAIDLPAAVASYVDSRRAGARHPIAFRDLVGRPLPVRFSARDLNRVLDVLLDNAARAMSPAPGGGIRLETAWDGGRFARLTFEDDGPGIPPGERDAIFSMGFTRSSGEGFGLYYARRTLDRAGGSIALAPSASGAKFELRFEALGATAIEGDDG